MTKHIGLLGLVIGLVAVGIAIFQDDLRAHSAPPPLPPPPPPEKDASFKELAIKTGKKLIETKVLKEDAAPAPVLEEPKAPRDGIALLYMGLGFLAIVLGVVSWVRKEHIRLSGGAVALGLVAVAWQFVLIGVAIAIIILIVSNVSF